MIRMKQLYISLVTIALFVASTIFLSSYSSTKKSSTGAEEKQNPVLMKVGNDEVTKSEFIRVYKKNNVKGEVIDKKSIDEYLDLYVNFKLKVNEAEELGLDTVNEFKNELSGYREQLAKPYLVDDETREMLMREAYDRLKKDVRASHILIKVKETAAPEDTLEAYNKITALRERILKGADFGEVAVEKSEDASARERKMRGRVIPGNKGDLGYFSAFDMVYPFENGVHETPEGELSDPVRTRYGYHLIKVTDKKPALGEVKVAHILIRIPDDADQADSLDAKNMADSLYNDIINGAEFAEMAKKHSDDPGTARIGGKLPKFGSNRMIPKFVYEVSKLNNIGDVGEPFTTRFGYHLVKLLEEDTIGSFEDEKADIKKQLKKSDRSEISKESMVAKIKKEYGYELYKVELNDFTKILTDSIFHGKWNVSNADELNASLFKIGDKEYNQQEFAKYLNKTQRRRKDTIDYRIYVNDQFKKFLKEKAIAYEDSMLEEKYPDFRFLMQEYRDGILLFELTDQKVWTKAVEDTLGLEEYYKQHKENYMWGKRLEASLFSFEHPEKQLEIAQYMAKGGMSDEDILARFNDSTQMVSVNHKKFPKGENEIIDRIKWEPGIVLSEDKDGEEVLVRVNQVIEPQPKKLKEARGLVTADYQDYLEEKWINSLREKYTVEVNDDVLQSIKKELTTSE